MKVRALRGVCVGVERHLVAGDVDDLEAALVSFLVSIGAVERVPESTPVEPAKVEAVPDPVPEVPESETPSPAKPGKKEK